MGHTNKLILIMIFVFLKQAISMDDEQHYTLPSKLASLRISQLALPKISQEDVISNNLLRPLLYDQASNTYTLTLDDNQLDGRSPYTINCTFDENPIANIISDANTIRITCTNTNSNFVITNRRYEIGTCDKNLVVTCGGSLTFSNMVRAHSISMEAISICFQDEIFIKENLHLKVRSSLQFSVPYLAPSQTEVDLDGFINFSSSPNRPSRISWKKLRVLQQDLSQEYFYNAILRLALINQTLDINLDNKSQLSFILNNCKNKDFVADELVQNLFVGNGYRSINTKMFEGNSKGNGFDGFFVKENDRILVEVKFDNREDTTSPKPGKLNIHGINWPQLSTPYNKKILKDMHIHPNLKEAFDLIMQHQESIRLYFIVLNAKKLTLDWYDAGMFLHSNFK